MVYRDGADGVDYDLAAAYGELQNLTLDSSDVRDFLHKVAALACDVVVPPADCGITLRRGREVSTVATSGDGLAARADELQYARGHGPCMQTMNTGEVVIVPDMASETRWGDYPAAVREIGLFSSLSLPLRVRGRSTGALNLYSKAPHAYTPSEISRGELFASGTASALAFVLRRAEHETLTEQMRDALVTRAAIDQAMGIIMGQQRCSATSAFALLRTSSQNSNRKMYDVAADLIAQTTGHTFVAPRPFAKRDAN